MTRSFLALLGLAAFTSVAQAQSVEIVGSLSENVYASARSSGVAVVGAQVADADADARGTPEALEFAFYLPGEWEEEFVCVSAETADGLYDGRGTYRVVDPPPKDAGLVYTAPYPTGHFDRLVGLGAQELAIAVRRGECGGGSLVDRLAAGGALELAVASWRPGNGEIESADMLQLLINPFDAQRARLHVEGETIPCTRAAVPVTASYSMICEVPMTMLGGSHASLRIETLVPGRPPTDSVLDVHYPD